ncbi:MAG: hypothetical protein WDN30_09675 [Pararobbsia sp.]
MASPPSATEPVPVACDDEPIDVAEWADPEPAVAKFPIAIESSSSPAVAGTLATATLPIAIECPLASAPPPSSIGMAGTAARAVSSVFPAAYDSPEQSRSAAAARASEFDLRALWWGARMGCGWDEWRCVNDVIVGFPSINLNNAARRALRGIRIWTVVHYNGLKSLDE